MIERYSRPEFASIWSDESRFETWLAVELAACSAMEREGIVPEGTARAVSQSCEGKVSATRILEIEATTRHDVIAFLTHVEELAGPPARWLHLGLTSSDILDSSLALQSVRAMKGVAEGIRELLVVLRRRAEEESATPVMGRSHGIHAEPISAGLVFARWYSELRRALQRVESARDRIAVGKLAGAVGTYANMHPKVEAEALSALGLKPETVASQVVARDRHAELLNALAFVGAAIENMAVGVRHWQRTEVGEAEEGFGKGQKGSSAMPHKKNPILSENLSGLSRMLRAYAGASFENIALWHERDISHSSVERISIPDATILADFMLVRARRLIDGLVVRRDRMRANIELSGGLCFSEAVLLLLVRAGMPRQEAYVLVQRSALAAHEGRGDFKENLSSDSEILAHTDTEAIAKCFDLDHHLRHSDYIMQRVFSEAEG